MRIFTPPTAVSDHRRAIGEILGEYNEIKAGTGNPQSIAILLQDDDESTAGGLWANIYYDWMFVDLLAVAPEHRATGYGVTLVRQAENLAIANGCVGIWVDTFEFQAPNFWQKLGFEIFGVLENHPRGQQRVFLKKTLPVVNTER